MKALLDGGPTDGDQVEIGEDIRHVQGVFVWPLPAPAPRPDKPPWWRLRTWWAWRRWKPPPPPPLRSVDLLWERTAEVRDGLPVFTLVSPWEPYTVAVEPGPDLVRAFVVAQGKAHPAVRQDKRTRFVVSAEVYYQLRELTCNLPPPDPGEEDDEPWRQPPSQLLGTLLSVTRVEVVDDAGSGPFLYNPAYPAGWPCYVGEPDDWRN